MQLSLIPNCYKEPVEDLYIPMQTEQNLHMPELMANMTAQIEAIEK